MREESMKALILYRSFYGNTKALAEAMARGISDLGHQCVVQDLRQRLPALEDFDCAVIGSPTRMARPGHRALRTLRKLKRRGFAGKPVGLFDTYGPLPPTPEEREKARTWITPGAAGIMEKTARDLGLNVHGQAQRFEVSGMKGPLAEGALEKAAAFARELAQSVEPR
jgi:flavodoxin